MKGKGMSDVKIELNSDIIKGIVEAKLQAAIISELSRNPEQIVDGIVSAAFNQKVDDSGNVNRDSYYNKHNWVKQAVEKEIRTCAKETMVKWIDTQKAAIEKSMMKELTKQRDEMVKCFVESFRNNAANTYAFSVEVKPRSSN